MTQTLIMKIEASYSLNFLIYLQNIFLNQTEQGKIFRFPYMPISYSFHKDFDTRYHRLWIELVERLHQQLSQDMYIFIEEKETFFHRLFNEDNQMFDEYIKLHHSFQSWWDSLAGRFSLERALDNNGSKVYKALAKELQHEGIKSQRELTISILYDECRLGNPSPFPCFVPITIENWHIKDRELLDKLKASL